MIKFSLSKDAERIPMATKIAAARSAACLKERLAKPRSRCHLTTAWESALSYARRKAEEDRLRLFARLDLERRFAREEPDGD